MKNPRHPVRIVCGTFLLSALLLALACSSRDPESSAGIDNPSTETEMSRSPRLDPDAEEALQAMSATLKGLPEFQFRVQETLEGTFGDGRTLPSTRRRRVAVQRPNKVFTEAGTAVESRRSWYNGETFSLYDKARNQYATIKAPATIDETVDFLAQELGLILPVADLLFSDPYAILTANLIRGDHVGIHRVDGKLCHHLAFEQEAIDWQIWIDAGEVALPRRLVITYIQEPSVPEFTATIDEWNTKPALTETTFEFQPPAGATRVEMDALVGSGARKETGR